MMGDHGFSESNLGSRQKRRAKQVSRSFQYLPICPLLFQVPNFSASHFWCFQTMAPDLNHFAKASAELTEEQCGSSILRQIRGAEQQALGWAAGGLWPGLMSHVPFHHFSKVNPENLENLWFVMGLYHALSFRGRFRLY